MLNQAIEQMSPLSVWSPLTALMVRINMVNPLQNILSLQGKLCPYVLTEAIFYPSPQPYRKQVSKGSLFTTGEVKKGMNSRDLMNQIPTPLFQEEKFLGL